MTRDELRKFYTFLKKETGIEGVPSRNLGSKEECVEAIRDLVCGTRSRVFKVYEETLRENLRFVNEKIELEKELENLKNKKWWKRLWNM